MKFIYTKWTNGEFKMNWLRRVTKETKTQYVCDVQRTAYNWSEEPKRFVYIDKWAHRFHRLPKGQAGYRPTRLSNPDGKMEVEVVKDFKSLICKESFTEIFKDLTLCGCDKSDWDYEFTQYLSKLFSVPVIKLYVGFGEKGERGYGLFHHTATYMHVNQFGDDKKFISFDENFHNRTITFWLFEDKLVFKHEEGIDTW